MYLQYDEKRRTRDSMYTLRAHIICMAAHFQDIKMHEAIYLIFDYETT